MQIEKIFNVKNLKRLLIYGFLLYILRLLICNGSMFYYYDCICRTDKITKKSNTRGVFINKINCIDDIVNLFKEQNKKIPINYIELEKFIYKNENEINKKLGFKCLNIRMNKFIGNDIFKNDDNKKINKDYYNLLELKKGYIVYFTNKNKYFIYALDYNNELVEWNGGVYYKTNNSSQ